MSCTLNKLTTYDVGRVVKDESSGIVTVQLVNPPSSCDDKVFTSKTAKIQVTNGYNPTLTYNISSNMPSVNVPNKHYVEYINGGLGMWWVVIALGLFAGLCMLIRRLQEPSVANIRNPGYQSTSNDRKRKLPLNSDQQERVNSTGQISSITSTPVVFNNTPNSTNSHHLAATNAYADGFLTAALVGTMLYDNHHSHDNTTTIIERERVIEREQPESQKSDSYSSDSVSDNSNYSSDSNDSYSSDSSSSYSSDSSYSSGD